MIATDAVVPKGLRHPTAILTQRFSLGYWRSPLRGWRFCATRRVSVGWPLCAAIACVTSDDPAHGALRAGSGDPRRAPDSRSAPGDAHRALTIPRRAPGGRVLAVCTKRVPCSTASTEGDGCCGDWNCERACRFRYEADIETRFRGTFDAPTARCLSGGAKCVRARR